MKRKRPNVALCILIVAAVWALWGVEKYHNRHHDRWSSLVLFSACVAFTAAISAFIVYSVVKKKTYIGGRGIAGRWIYRHEDPVIYWMYIGLYLFFNGAMIYAVMTLIPKIRNVL